MVVTKHETDVISSIHSKMAVTRTSITVRVRTRRLPPRRTPHPYHMYINIQIESMDDLSFPLAITLSLVYIQSQTRYQHLL